MNAEQVLEAAFAFSWDLSFFAVLVLSQSKDSCALIPDVVSPWCSPLFLLEEILERGAS